MAGSNNPLESAAPVEKSALQKPGENATATYDKVMAGNPQAALRAMDQSRNVPNAPLPVFDLEDRQSFKNQPKPKSADVQTTPAHTSERQRGNSLGTEIPGVTGTVIKSMEAPVQSGDKQNSGVGSELPGVNGLFKKGADAQVGTVTKTGAGEIRIGTNDR
jgi:hypothetical protein